MWTHLSLNFFHEYRRKLEGILFWAPRGPDQLEHLPSQLNSQFAPNWTGEDSHGPMARFATFKTPNSGLTGTQSDPKIGM
jgi:hypothetical protein